MEVVYLWALSEVHTFDTWNVSRDGSVPVFRWLVIVTTIDCLFMHDLRFIQRWLWMENNAVQSVENQPTFRRNMSPPSLGSRNKSSTCFLPHTSFLISLFFDSKMEATCFSETSVDFQLTALRYILVERTLPIMYCLNVQNIGNGWDL
jgi:hypothetical protein